MAKLFYAAIALFACGVVAFAVASQMPLEPVPYSTRDAVNNVGASCVGLALFLTLMGAFKTRGWSTLRSFVAATLVQFALVGVGWVLFVLAVVAGGGFS